MDDPTLEDMQEMERLSLKGYAFTYTKDGWHHYSPKENRHSQGFPTAAEMLFNLKLQ